MFGLGIGLSVLLVLCILCVCSFEFIYGFYDTANAVATVIYTKSLKPWRALSVGVGTMIGWERIVITIGEKIGKTHLTYAQGASAEIVAASTIAASTYLGLPVSTTHVLSSGIAGAMFSSGGLSNLDKGMIQKILMAWVLTFPVCVTLSGTLFLIFRSVCE